MNISISKAQHILLFIIGVIFFGIFINIYQAPKATKWNVIMQSLNDNSLKFASNPDTPENNHEFDSSKFSDNGPNFAPNLKLSTIFKCTEPKLWGKDHQGGWYVCISSEAFNRENLISNTLNKCAVYSYGLGADWSFDQQAEIEGCEVCFNFSLCHGFAFAFISH